MAAAIKLLSRRERQQLLPEWTVVLMTCGREVGPGVGNNQQQAGPRRSGQGSHRCPQQQREGVHSGGGAASLSSFFPPQSRWTAGHWTAVAL